MKKPSKVVFIDDRLENSYYSLDDTDSLKHVLKRAIEDLQSNAFVGIHIPKRLIPKEFVQKYNVNNLWKYDLPRGWRLLYTLTADDQVQLITAILEWSNHKKYERRMGY